MWLFKWEEKNIYTKTLRCSDQNHMMCVNKDTRECVYKDMDWVTDNCCDEVYQAFIQWLPYEGTCDKKCNEKK